MEYRTETLSFIIPQCVFGFSFQILLFSIFHLFFLFTPHPITFLFELLSANSSHPLSVGRSMMAAPSTTPDDADGYMKAPSRRTSYDMSLPHFFCSSTRAEPPTPAKLWGRHYHFHCVCVYLSGKCDNKLRGLNLLLLFGITNRSSHLICRTEFPPTQVLQSTHALLL